MKTRQGFVSNSSSSSFLIYGIRLTSGDLKNIVTENEHLKEAINNDCELYEIAEIALSKSSFDYSSPPYSDCIYIGSSWDTIGDNETGAEFKAAVQQEIKEIFGEGFKCSTYEEAWYNG